MAFGGDSCLSFDANSATSAFTGSGSEVLACVSTDKALAAAVSLSVECSSLDCKSRESSSCVSEDKVGRGFLTSAEVLEMGVSRSLTVSHDPAESKGGEEARVRWW